MQQDLKICTTEWNTNSFPWDYYLCKAQPKTAPIT